MARTLNSPVEDIRAEFVYLYEINHSGGVLRITNSSNDIVALTFTWTAVGAQLIHHGAPEGPDQKAQGTELTLYGVDQTIIEQIQNNQFRGRLLKIYMLFYDPDTGVQDTPDLIFQGRQNGDYQVTESRDPGSTESGGTVTVTTRITADLASINSKVSTRCNVISHEAMLARAGVVAPDDKFFERVPSIINLDVYWGKFAPEQGGFVGPDRRGDGNGDGDDNDEDIIWW